MEMEGGADPKVPHLHRQSLWNLLHDLRNTPHRITTVTYYTPYHFPSEDSYWKFQVDCPQKRNIEFQIDKSHNYGKPNLSGLLNATGQFIFQVLCFVDNQPENLLYRFEYNVHYVIVSCMGMRLCWQQSQVWESDYVLTCASCSQ